jgi:hypothetical protein
MKVSGTGTGTDKPWLSSMLNDTTPLPWR